MLYPGFDRLMSKIREIVKSQRKTASLCRVRQFIINRAAYNVLNLVISLF